MSKESLFNDINDAILNFDEKKLKECVNKALAQGVAPIEIIEEGLAKALRVVGDKFEKGEFFLMHLISAAEMTQKIIKEEIEPRLKDEKRKTLGKIVLGTVQGDIHDIGKNIVGALLFSAGFEVHDIGKDAPPELFVEKAKEVGADVVGASALLSTTLPNQKKIIEALKAAGMRDKVKVIFGGAPVTREWVEEIGGDGYAENATEAVRVVKKLLNIN
jgi:corrinoid protein of di/trimethylamine methyltransferase